MENETTQIPVPPTVIAAEAMAEAAFWRERSRLNAVLRFQAEQELAALKEQLASSEKTKKGEKNATSA